MITGKARQWSVARGGKHSMRCHAKERSFRQVESEHHNHWWQIQHAQARRRSSSVGPDDRAETVPFPFFLSAQRERQPVTRKGGLTIEQHGTYEWIGLTILHSMLRWVLRPPQYIKDPFHQHCKLLQAINRSKYHLLALLLNHGIDRRFCCCFQRVEEWNTEKAEEHVYLISYC
jgi:hypothetical protein